jgi:hypothetical protein
VGFFRGESVSGASGPILAWSVSDYPPGTELPMRPAPDLSNFPRWLRPLAVRRLSKQDARRRRWLEEQRDEYFSTSSSQPPRLITTMPAKFRRRHRRAWKEFAVAMQAEQLARWKAEHRDGPGSDEP